MNEREFRLSQYADGTQICLILQIFFKETLNISNTFYVMSGLKINVEKTRQFG